MKIPSSNLGRTCCVQKLFDIQNNFCTQYVLCKKKSFSQRFTCMWDQTGDLCFKTLSCWFGTCAPTRPKTRRSRRIRQKKLVKSSRKKNPKFLKKHLDFFFVKTCKNTLRNALRNRYPCKTRRRIRQKSSSNQFEEKRTNPKFLKKSREFIFVNTCGNMFRNRYYVRPDGDLHML